MSQEEPERPAKRRRPGKPIMAAGALVAAALGAWLIHSNLELGVRVEAKIMEGCAAHYPIAVTVRNYTYRTVKQVYFDMELYRHARTTNRLKARMARVRSHVFDQLVRPFEKVVLCYTDPYIDSFYESVNALNAPTSLDATKLDFSDIDTYGWWEEPLSIAPGERNAGMHLQDAHQVHLGKIDVEFF